MPPLHAGLLERLGQQSMPNQSVRSEACHSRSAGVETAVPERRVFILEWLDPPFDAGHWVPEIQQVLPLHDLHCSERAPRGDRHHRATALRSQLTGWSSERLASLVHCVLHRHATPLACRSVDHPQAGPSLLWPPTVGCVSGPSGWPGAWLECALPVGIICRQRSWQARCR